MISLILHPVSYIYNNRFTHHVFNYTCYFSQTQIPLNVFFKTNSYSGQPFNLRIVMFSIICKCYFIQGCAFSQIVIFSEFLENGQEYVIPISRQFRNLTWGYTNHQTVLRNFKILLKSIWACLKNVKSKTVTQTSPKLLNVVYLTYKIILKSRFNSNKNCLFSNNNLSQFIM